MLSEERQRAILETLDRDGRVLVVDLAKHFQRSTVTIRNDRRYECWKTQRCMKERSCTAKKSYGLRQSRRVW